MCEEVNASGAFVPGALEGMTKFPFKQSRTFDSNILCQPCDGILGPWESVTINTFREIRSQAAGMRDRAFGTVNADADSVLRFCAGVLYKYSLTTDRYGRIELGPHKELLRQVAFGKTDIPTFLNAALFRLRLRPDDDAVYTYRAPKKDREKGTGAHTFRMLVGGVLLFVRVDKRPMVPSALSPLCPKGRDDVIFTPVRAREFEESWIPQRIVRGSEKLQAMLPDWASEGRPPFTVHPRHAAQQHGGKITFMALAEGKVTSRTASPKPSDSSTRPDRFGCLSRAASTRLATTGRGNET